MGTRPLLFQPASFLSLSFFSFIFFLLPEQSAGAGRCGGRLARQAGGRDMVRQRRRRAGSEAEPTESRRRVEPASAGWQAGRRAGAGEERRGADPARRPRRPDAGWRDEPRPGGGSWPGRAEDDATRRRCWGRRRRGGARGRAHAAGGGLQAHAPRAEGQRIRRPGQRDAGSFLFALGPDFSLSFVLFLFAEDGSSKQRGPAGARWVPADSRRGGVGEPARAGAGCGGRVARAGAGRCGGQKSARSQQASRRHSRQAWFGFGWGRQCEARIRRQGAGVAAGPAAAGRR